MDDDDFEWLSQFKWYAARSGSNVYARRQVRVANGRKALHMQHDIVNAPSGTILTFRDSNSLNLTRSNIRISPYINKASKRSSSGFIGVHFRKQIGLWEAGIGVARKRLFLGYFSDPATAARAFDRASCQHYGEFAHVNPVKTG